MQTPTQTIYEQTTALLNKAVNNPTTTQPPTPVVTFLDPPTREDTRPIVQTALSAQKTTGQKGGKCMENISNRTRTSATYQTEAETTKNNKTKTNNTNGLGSQGRTEETMNNNLNTTGEEMEITTYHGPQESRAETTYDQRQEQSYITTTQMVQIGMKQNLGPADFIRRKQAERQQQYPDNSNGEGNQKQTSERGTPQQKGTIISSRKTTPKATDNNQTGFFHPTAVINLITPEEEELETFHSKSQIFGLFRTQNPDPCLAQFNDEQQPTPWTPTNEQGETYEGDEEMDTGNNDILEENLNVIGYSPQVSTLTQEEIEELMERGIHTVDNGEKLREQTQLEQIEEILAYNEEDEEEPTHDREDGGELAFTEEEVAYNNREQPTAYYEEEDVFNYTEQPTTYYEEGVQ
jgi:hypothetical protein